MNQSRSLDYGYQSQAFYSGYYRHSGKVNFPGVAASILAGLAAGLVLAWLYVLADLYIPLVQLNLLAVLAFGAAMGAMPAIIMRRLKVRNVAVTLAVVLVVTLFAYYITWAAWEWMLLRKVPNAPTFWQLALNPGVILRLAVQINAVGTWKMSEHDEEAAKGVFLSIVWAGEAICIFGCALFLSRSIARDTPFCERCDRWCSPKRTVLSTGAGDPAKLRQHLEDKDFTYLATLGRPPAQAGRTWNFVHHRCEKCNQLHTLSVIDVTTKLNRKGKAQRKSVTLVDKLLVSPEEVIGLAPPKPVRPVVPAPVADRSSSGTAPPLQPPTAPHGPDQPATGLARLASLDDSRSR